MTRRRGLRVYFFCAVVLTLVSLNLEQAHAQAGDKCSEEYAGAETHFLENQFDDAARLLQQCLDRESLLNDEAVRVYRLLALVFINLGDFDQARLAVANLLGRAPAYTPDPVQDPPTYMTLVGLVKEQLAIQTPQPEPLQEAVDEEPARTRRSWFSGNRRWLLLAGGAVLVGTATLLAFGSGTGGSVGTQPLPPPPALP